MKRIIKNGTIINEGSVFPGNILIENDTITAVGPEVADPDAETVDASGCFVMPGVIDDQVHFREPGLTHKGDIREGSRAAVAGGVTSFMDMPNVNPPTVTLDLLREKQELAAGRSFANYSFYLGATSGNIGEIKKADPRTVCGVKVFMGSSTGNMLVSDLSILEAIFAESPVLIATHCEDTPTIEANLKKYKAVYGAEIPVKMHPLIRSREACCKSSALAASLAKKYGSRLHILHLSTAEETALPDTCRRSEKRITGEACVHHLFFNDSAYDTLGSLVRWNPAIKTENDRRTLLDAVNRGVIDVVATDHAPHTLQEKEGSYEKAAGGGPLIQHSLVMMLELAERGETTLEKVIDAMCHAPAEIFGIDRRGFLRPGYKADICIFKKEKWPITPENILYKCGWSPLTGMEFSYKVTKTFVNGHCVYDNGSLDETPRSEMLEFVR